MHQQPTISTFKIQIHSQTFCRNVFVVVSYCMLSLALGTMGWGHRLPQTLLLPCFQRVHGLAEWDTRPEHVWSAHKKTEFRKGRQRRDSWRWCTWCHIFQNRLGHAEVSRKGFPKMREYRENTKIKEHGGLSVWIWWNKMCKNRCWAIVGKAGNVQVMLALNAVNAEESGSCSPR